MFLHIVRLTTDINNIKRKNEELNRFMVLLDGIPNLVEPEFNIDTYRIGVTKLAIADGILTV